MVYQQIAALYDRLMIDAPYNDWLHFTSEIFDMSGRTIKKVADLGCGTGKITTGLAKAGYEMIGVDYSTDMLAYAEQRASSERLNIQWIHQDLRDLNGIGSMDAVVSYCDVMNYITSELELISVFNHVADMLLPGGLFIFDVHSLYHVENNLVGQTFAETDDDVSYIWFCSPGETSGEMYHDVTFFVQTRDNKYERFEEYHHQRTYSIDFYQKLLHKAGLEIIDVYGDFSLQENSVHEKTERIFFVVRKKLAKKQSGK